MVHVYLRLLVKTAEYRPSHIYAANTAPTCARSIYSHHSLDTPLPLRVYNLLPAPQKSQDTAAKVRCRLHE